MAKTPLVELNTGALMPAIGLGTWQGDATEERNQIKDATLVAIAAGYRHIDTAWIYNSERAVGEAIRASGVPRAEFFVVTKLWNTRHRPEDVPEALEESLGNLGLDYVDLYLMHWPAAWDRSAGRLPLRDPACSKKLDRGVTFVDTWKAMEKLDKAKVRAIGVSNFSLKTFDVLLAEADVVPAANQVELHPYLQQPELKAYCDAKGIVLTAYSPLGQGSGNLLEDSTLQRIAKSRGAAVGQVVLSWMVQGGWTAVPKSGNPERLRQNISLIELSDEEMMAIRALDQCKRLACASDPMCGWSHEEMGW